MAPLARAALLAAAGVALVAQVPSATAQPAGAAAAEQSRRGFDVPPGPLDQVLIRFGRQSGAQIAVNAELTAGVTSPGVTGSHTVAEALAQLLVGTGLHAVRDAGGEYTLRRMARATAADAAPQGPGSTMPSIKVKAQSIKDGVTEGSASYTAAVMSTATKLPLSMRETPQSVTVITRERIADQALATPGDALLNTPGITVSSISGPNREIYYARGFRVENYTFDGLPASFTTTGGQVLVNDLAVYDRVEVVRGAAGLTQGAGTPSAAINFVRKRPTREFQASVQGQLGSWNHRGAEIDVSGPLGAGGGLRGRVVAHARDSDSFQDVATEDRRVLYLVGEADIGSSTLLTASVSQQKNDNITTYAGLPTAKDGSDLKLPRSTFFGSKWNYWDETNTSAFASVEHRFDNRWKLNFAINRIWGDQDRFVNGIALNGTGGWDLTGGKAVIRNDRSSQDLYAQGPLRLFGREHQVVVGAGARAADEGSDVAGYWPPIYLANDIDIRNWHHDATRPATVTEDYHYASRERQHGVYGTVRLNLADPLKLILGLRLDWFKFNATDDVYDWDAGTWTRYPGGYEYDRHPTQYAGIVYDVDARHSVYASYTDVFKPQNAYTTAHEWIEPIVGKNYEVGVKGEYFSGALNVAAAVFRIDEENRAMAAGNCPFNPSMTCYQAAGVVRSNGWDVEVQGALAPGWQVGAGYSAVGIKVHKDSDPAQVGVRLNTDLPRRQFKLSTSYRLPASGWRVGGSVRWQDAVDHFDDWMGYDYRTGQRAYAVVGAMVGYQFGPQLDVQFNVTNLFDRVYYRVINTQPVEWGGNALYGAPRRAMLTARYTF